MRQDASLAEAVGRLLIIGYEGRDFRPELEELLLETRPAGLILFARNIPEVPGAGEPLADREALKAVLGRSRELALAEFGRPLLIAVDQEGGPVKRLRPPFCQRPAQREVALRESPEVARSRAKLAAEELRTAGFNLNLAPVLDLATSPASEFMRARSFGADPEVASRYGRAVLAGHQAGGILSCAKHFPGLGDAVIDPHEELAGVFHSRPRLERIEFQPFRGLIAAGLESVMTSHVLVPALDPEYPATFSPATVAVLKDELGLAGPVLTDDLEMGAVIKNRPLGRAAVAAIGAGHDLALVCRRPGYIAQAREALAKAVLSGELSSGRLADAEERLHKLLVRIA